MPAELWAQAVEVARIEGAEVTARALRLDRRRLEARMKNDAGDASGGFIELDASRLGLSPKAVVRFVAGDGDRIEVELGAVAIDVVALVETFLRRAR